MTNTKTLIISDVDGTITQSGMSISIDEQGKIQYLFKTYEQHLGIIKKILKENSFIKLEFISNGCLGAKINGPFIHQSLQLPYHLCRNKLERIEKIREIIDRHKPERIIYISDLAEEAFLFETIDHKDISFITDKVNYEIYGKHLPKIKDVIRDKFIDMLMINFSEGHILLRVMSFLKNDVCPTEVGFYSDR